MQSPPSPSNASEVGSGTALMCETKYPFLLGFFCLNVPLF